MKKIITAALPFALFAMALTSCGGSPSAEEYSVTFPDINGLVPPTNLKVKKGEDYSATIGVNQTLVPGATLPKDLTKVTSGNGVLTKGDGYTYDLKENDTKADFKIPAKNITGDIAVELELVVPTPGEVKVTSIDFTLEKDEATVSEQVKIKDIKVLPDNATNKNINWSVTPEGYAEIHTMGAEPYVVGTAPTQEPLTITATAADGSGVKKTATLSITPKYIESLVVTMGELKVGETKTPGVQITPNDATDHSYHLVITEGTDYAEVVEEGHSLKGLAAGKAKVKAVADDGSEVESEPVQFEVKTVAATSIEVDATDTLLYLGNTTQLYTTITPEDATVQDVTYAVTTGDAVTVDEDGEVTAAKVGTATITATLTQTGIGGELTDTINITVSDDLLIGAEAQEEKLPFEFLDEYDGRDSVVKISDDEGANSTQLFNLNHTIPANELNQYVLSFDYYSTLTGGEVGNNNFKMQFMDSKWKVLDHMFWIGGPANQWNNNVQFYLGGLDHTGGDLADLAFIRIWFLNAGSSYATGDLYLDNFKMVKGSTYTTGNVTNNFNDFKCVTRPISEYTSLKQAYLEIKAEGTGSFKFMIEDESWKNISGDTTITITDGVPSGSTVLDVEKLEDGWYGIAIKLGGDGFAAAQALNMFYVATITDLSSVTVDLNSLRPYNTSVFTNTDYVTLGNPVDITNLADDGSNALHIKARAIPVASPSGDIKFGFTLHAGPGWKNYTGWMSMIFNPDGTIKQVNTPSTVDPTIVVEQLTGKDAGWSLIKLKRTNFQYPHGQDGGGDEQIKVLEPKAFENLVKVFVDFAEMYIA